MLYRAVPRNQILDAFGHIYNLQRQMKPSTERELRAYERSEAAARDLLSNLPRSNQHPTLKTLVEIAEICGLTLGGVHKLFGYDLGAIREYDLNINGARTHIIESYPFDRDLTVDFPLRLAPAEAFRFDAMLGDLVMEWQRSISMRALDEVGWTQQGTFYIHVGTEDSRGSSLPPGSVAMVVPASETEKKLPNSRAIYLLQFGNGYRCSHCVVAGGRLRPFTTGKSYLGRDVFAYPGEVRIAGRIRMFAVSLPVPEYAARDFPSHCKSCADLILPWEHRNRGSLLATEHLRFRRSRKEEQGIRASLEAALDAKLSGRTERRYRSSSTVSQPHVSILLHMALATIAGYTDALRAGESWSSDKGLFSLESLLKANRIEDALITTNIPVTPTPSEVWDALRHEFVEWPLLLSLKFPQLRAWSDRMLRLSAGSDISGLEPAIGPGSWMIVETASSVPDPEVDSTKAGWGRPLYIFRRGLRIYCGYLERIGAKCALVTGSRAADSEASFPSDELALLHRVVGVAVPV